MLLSCSEQSAVSASNISAERRRENQPASRCEGKATVLTTWCTGGYEFNHIPLKSGRRRGGIGTVST